MPEDGKEDIKDKVEELAEHAADGSVNIPIDIDKNGKPDIIISVKGKLVVTIGTIIAVSIGLAKLFGLW
jgi:hypothetical protein